VFVRLWVLKPGSVRSFYGNQDTPRPKTANNVEPIDEDGIWWRGEAALEGFTATLVKKLHLKALLVASQADCPCASRQSRSISGLDLASLAAIFQSQGKSTLVQAHRRSAMLSHQGRPNLRVEELEAEGTEQQSSIAGLKPVQELIAKPSTSYRTRPALRKKGLQRIAHEPWYAFERHVSFSTVCCEQHRVVQKLEASEKLLSGRP